MQTMLLHTARDGKLGRAGNEASNYEQIKKPTVAENLTVPAVQ